MGPAPSVGIKPSNTGTGQQDRERLNEVQKARQGIKKLSEFPNIPENWTLCYKI